MTAAANLHDVAKEEAEQITGELDAREKADLDTSYGVVERGRRPREYAPALAALEKCQKTRAKRRILDVVDRGLMDLVSVYRDAIVVASRAPAPSWSTRSCAATSSGWCGSTTPEENLRRIEAIFDGPRADAGVQRARRLWHWSR